MQKLIKLLIISKLVITVNSEKVQFQKDTVINLQKINLGQLIATKLITIMIGSAEILRKRARMIRWNMIILRKCQLIRLI